MRFSIYLAVLAEEKEEFDFKGMFHGSQSVVGIVLIVVGLLTVWLGWKLWQGYKLLPEPKTGIPQEDRYVPAQAKVLQKKKQVFPAVDGHEERILIQWKIGYEVGEEKYTQIVGDDGYKKGDLIDIKYDPDDPQRFYIDDGPAVTEEEAEPEEEAEEHNSTGIIVSLLGVIVAAVGVILLL